MSVDLLVLQDTPLEELVRRATALTVPSAEHLRRADLIYEIARREGQRVGEQYGRGVLEVHGEGFGFLRSPEDNFLPGAADIYVSQSQIRRFKLQTGDTVVGLVRSPKEGERYTALLRVELVNGDAAGVEPPAFDSLTAVYPTERIPLAADPVLRSVDFVAPLGLGQRGLLVAPGRTGRVELLRRMVDALSADESLEVTVLLIDERPEEIQEWRQTSRAEIIATPFDESAQRHLQVADIVFERARRMAERGDDAVVVVDSLTRLLRACLAEVAPSGRAIGGIDVAALHRLRRYLGAARALEEGGSLTVLAVVSGDPEAPMDQVLLEDLRDVANWELTLSRGVADRGIRPPIDVGRSGTRRSERLLTDDERQRRARWRGALSGDPLEDATALVALVSGPTPLDKVTATS